MASDARRPRGYRWAPLYIAIGLAGFPLLLGSVGYSLGRDMAQRDNARAVVR
jgi:hypothetical protein